MERTTGRRRYDHQVVPTVHDSSLTTMITLISVVTITSFLEAPDYILQAAMVATPAPMMTFTITAAMVTDP